MSGWARNVWSPDRDDKPATENVIGKISAEDSAEREAEDNYVHDDYPQIQTVHVIDDDGQLFVFEVEAVHDVSFSASLVVKRP